MARAKRQKIMVCVFGWSQQEANMPPQHHQEPNQFQLKLLMVPIDEKTVPSIIVAVRSLHDCTVLNDDKHITKTSNLTSKCKTIRLSA